MHITVYTDGSSSGNPGPGGYGCVLMTADGKHTKELSQGYRLTTNNRMELLAVIVALEALKNPGCEVLVCSDSEYVIHAVDKGWLWNWMKTGFKGKKNEDLWRRFAQVYRKHTVKFKWVKGHANNFWNERCDQLAVAAGKAPDLLTDEVFEAEKKLGR